MPSDCHMLQHSNCHRQPTPLDVLHWQRPSWHLQRSDDLSQAEQYAQLPLVFLHPADTRHLLAKLKQLVLGDPTGQYEMREIQIHRCDLLDQCFPPTWHTLSTCDGNPLPERLRVPPYPYPPDQSATPLAWSLDRQYEYQPWHWRRRGHA